MIEGVVRKAHSKEYAESGKDKIEIWFNLKYEKYFPDSYDTENPIIVIFGEKKYEMIFRKTRKNKYLWISPNVLEDKKELKLSDVMTRYGYSNKQKIFFIKTGENVYEVVQDVAFDLELQNEYSKSQIESIFDTKFGNRIKGITQRRDSFDQQYIILFSRTDGPYTDRTHDDVFYYDGEGLEKNQELTPANKALIESNEKEIPIFCFLQEANKTKWKYLGLVTVIDYEYVQKGEYKVYEFRMKMEGIENISEVKKERKELNEISVKEPMLTDQVKVTKSLQEHKSRSTAFKDNIKKIYDFKCAVCGKKRFTQTKYPEVESAHIYPKEKNGSDDLRNGISLCKLHHWAFDGGLFSISDDLKVLVKKSIVGDDNYLEISKYYGKSIIYPSDHRFKPHALFLKEHRKIHGYK